MIMIDVLVPPLDRAFDFEVDEGIDVERLREDVERLIEAKEKMLFSTKKRQMFLYRKGDFLRDGITLTNQGVINGDRLILV